MENLRDKILRSQISTHSAITRSIEHRVRPDAGSHRDGAEEGSTTVEYAIGAVATAAFAGLLLAVLNSGGVRSMLTNIINSALSI